MFRTDFIPFKIIPVAGIADLSACNEELIQGHDDVRIWEIQLFFISSNDSIH